MRSFTTCPRSTKALLVQWRPPLQGWLLWVAVPTACGGKGCMVRQLRAVERKAGATFGTVGRHLCVTCGFGESSLTKGTTKAEKSSTAAS